MNDVELKIQCDRTDRYQRLAAQLTDIRHTLLVFNTPFGHHKCSAFTGNTRESRQIVSMKFQFSQTRGGEDAVELEVGNLNVEAHEVGDLLRRILEERAATIRQAMEKI